MLGTWVKDQRLEQKMFLVLLLGNSKAFRSSVPGARGGDHYLYFPLAHTKRRNVLAALSSPATSFQAWTSYLTSVVLFVETKKRYCCSISYDSPICNRENSKSLNRKVGGMFVGAQKPTTE